MSRQYSNYESKKLMYDLVNNLEPNLKQQVLNKTCFDDRWSCTLRKIMTPDKYDTYCFRIESRSTCPGRYSVMIPLLNTRICATSQLCLENAFEMTAELYIYKLRENYIECIGSETTSIEAQCGDEIEERNEECSAVGNTDSMNVWSGNETEECNAVNSTASMNVWRGNEIEERNEECSAVGNTDSMNVWRSNEAEERSTVGNTASMNVWRGNETEELSTVGNTPSMNVWSGNETEECSTVSNTASMNVWRGNEIEERNEECSTVGNTASMNVWRGNETEEFSTVGNTASMNVWSGNEIEERNEESVSDIRFWNDKIVSLISVKYNELKKDLNSASVVACVFMIRNDDTELISFTSGNKCISGTYLTNDGEELIDSHAEILAIRVLRCYLYTQLFLYYTSPHESIFELHDATHKYVLKNDISFGLYISSAPCGDSRVFKELELKGTYPKSCIPGALRIKLESGHTARAILGSFYENKNPTWEEIKRGSCQLMTMCCSDKILRMNLLGVQGALLSLLIEPIYLSAIILGERLSSVGIKRSLYGRAGELASLSGTYRLTQPKFFFSSVPEGFNPKSSKQCLNWNVISNSVEITRNETGRPMDGSTSRISKSHMFSTFMYFLCLHKQDMLKNWKELSYYDFKMQARDYQETKQILIETLKNNHLGQWKSNPPNLDQFFSKHDLE